MLAVKNADSEFEEWDLGVVHKVTNTDSFSAITGIIYLLMNNRKQTTLF